uniref:Beta1-3 glucan recognition protein n=1 Tax=Ostrinia furnacalis TaxID=93504 RepID=T1VXX4_OSTFU|nr:beta1-3 glucan recognition protein [Ostrinia furnacalis]
MAVALVRRALTHTCVIAILLQTCCAQKFNIPDVKIEAFSPKGFRASIPDSPGMSLFVFQGNVNRAIDSTAVGGLKGEITQATNGRWVYDNPDAQLKVGDVVNYYVFVSVNREGFVKDGLTYTITEFSSRSGNPTGPNPTPTPDCRPSATRIRGGKACAGQTIFEDNFDSFKDDLWQIEQYIPINHPEFPFVSYQRLSPNGPVSVSGGFLHIAPKLQQTLPGFNNESIYTGSLDLFSGCTASAEACYRQAMGANILPPVASGRLTSSVAFTYGTVTIRAKLPQGDWMYPELLLEPFLKKYGSSHFASGVIKIASARGNADLRAGPDEYGNKILYGGPVMDFQCRGQLLTNKVLTNGKMWGDDFHEYSITWLPDQITLSVDGEQWARVDGSRALRDRFPQRCALPRTLLAKGSNLAPFDDHFYLTLGVAVGGISEFRDDAYSGDRAKPWRDVAHKAMLSFWEHLDSWQQTWNQPELVVDYVKVVAL